MASRALPPTDDANFAPPASVPQPRVYGRPARAEDDDPPPPQNPRAPLDGPALDYYSGTGRAAPPGEAARGSAAAPPPPAAVNGSAPAGFGPPPNRSPQGFSGTAQMRPVSPPPQHHPQRDFPGTGGWGVEPPADRKQERFAAFRPDPPDPGPPAQARIHSPAPASESPAEPAPPKERNGRVLAIVLVAAVLLVAVPLGVVYLVTRGDSSAFSPAIGDCLKRSGQSAVAASCDEPGAFTVVSETTDGAKCAYRNDFVVLPDSGRILCLRPQGAGATPTPAPSAS